MATKALITNKSALISKYGLSNFDLLMAAIDAWIAKDRTNGIIDTIVFVDDKVQMAKLNAPVVTNAKSQIQNKKAIDGIFNGLTPTTMVILGSQDIIPHQSLINPIPDEDETVPSDLPYACSAPYSRNPTKFIAPNRIITRLPDVTNYPKAFGQFLRLLSNVVSMQPQSIDKYKSYFAITTERFLKAEEQVCKQMFGDSKELYLSPPQGPDWDTSYYGRLSQYTALHGGSNDPNWYGEENINNKTESYKAFSSTGADTRISLGTVLVTECCYGAQLYDPINANNIFPICNVYMNNGAAAFYGSSTIVYAENEMIGASDTMIIVFMDKIKKGYNVGEACLAARQKVVSVYNPMDPMDLKVLLQFNPLGDSTVIPIKTSSDIYNLNTDLHVLRSQQLFLSGTRLEESIGIPILNNNLSPSVESMDIIAKTTLAAGIQTPNINTYEVKGGNIFANTQKILGIESKFHIVIEGAYSAFNKKSNFSKKISFSFLEQNGKIVKINKYNAIYR